MVTGQEQPLGEHLQQRYHSFVWQWLDMGRPLTELSLRQEEMAHSFLRASKEERTRYSEAEWRAIFEEWLAYLAEEFETERREIAAQLPKRRRKT